jgi:hypothetical protein
MTPCCQILGFSMLLAQAVRLIKGLEIDMQNGVISVSVCSFISWFKVSRQLTSTLLLPAAAAAAADEPYHSVPMATLERCNDCCCQDAHAC